MRWLAWGAQILQFSFALPPAGDMAALERWMTAVMAFTDIVGQYKLRPEQKVGVFPHGKHGRRSDLPYQK